MKKVVLNLDVYEEKCKQKAMKIASTLSGDIDPVAIVSKLRKVYHTEIFSVGPVKEPEKKKDEPKKEEASKKKDQNKKGEYKEQAKVGGLVTAFYSPPYHRGYFAESMEEDPNSCVIC